MAHVKSGGATRQHAQRPGKRLGVKIFGGESIKTGQIIVRQRGAGFHPGVNTDKGSDFTIYATAPGNVKYRKLNGIKYIDVVTK